MVKCRDCKFEMVFKSISKTEIILVCPNPNCGFQSSPIKLSSDYTSIDAIQASEEMTSKLSTTELIRATLVEGFFNLSFFRYIIDLS